MSFLNERRRSWKEIAMELSAETDRRRFGELVEELQNALAAREFGKKCQGHLAENDPYPVLGTRQGMEYEKIVDDAVQFMQSDCASLQMLYPERGAGGELRLLAFRGFNPQAARFWQWVRADSNSTCGIALRKSERVVARDIAACEFMADSADQQMYLQTGIYACQTTPLMGSAGSVVGMISTHWRTPHQPSEEDLRQFDVLARQASDLIERCMPRA